MSRVSWGTARGYDGARRAVLTLLVLGWLALSPVAAQAHDELTGTDPVDGATLPEAPETITLTFSGDLAQIGAQMTVHGPSGDAADGGFVVKAAQMSQNLVEGQPPGDYDVVWRVTSADGHPISGELTYTVLGADTTPSGSDAEPGDLTGDRPANPAATDSGPSTDVSPAESGPGSIGWLLSGATLMALAGLGLLALRRR